MYSMISVKQSDEVRTKLDQNWSDSYQTVGDQHWLIRHPVNSRTKVVLYEIGLKFV